MKSKRVNIITQTMGRRYYLEGQAEIVEDLGDHMAVVRFDHEPESYTRFVDPAAQVDYPELLAHIDELNRAHDGRHWVIARRDHHFGPTIRVDGKTLPLGPSLKLVNHSPTGFEWGYGGSGPAQLALGILLACGIGDEDALQIYQTFKRERIASAPSAGFDMTVGSVASWARAEMDRQLKGRCR